MTDTNTNAGVSVPVLAALYAQPSGCLTLTELADTAKLSRRQVEGAVSRLYVSGYVERSQPGRYCLTPAGRDAVISGWTPPKAPTGPIGPGRPRPKTTTYDRLWLALRKAGSPLSVADLIALCTPSTGKAPDRDTVRRYLRQLTRVGVLAQHPPKHGGTSPRDDRWRLRIDLGPQAPRLIRHCAAVWDANAKRELAPCT